MKKVPTVTVQIEIKPILYGENANFEKHGCQNSVAIITLMLTYASG